jgi:hypothetical protein
MRRSALVCLVGLFALPACFGSDANLTDSGEGRPNVTVDFPETVEAGSVATATFEIENPGPSDMDGLSLAFALLGRSDLPDSLVAFGAQRGERSVVEVRPEPTAVSADGAVYAFGGLEEGESTTIEFDLRMPSRPGVYANSVTASEASNLERSRGVRLETEVEG